MPRVKLIQNREDLAPEHDALFTELAALRGRISGPSTVVLHSPGLARPWNEISEYLHGESVVAAEDAELAVCAAAREKECGYVWNAHTAAARRAGVSEETISLVRERRPVEGLGAHEALVVRYVRGLLHDHRVEDEVFEGLLKAHGPKWLVELTVWIARYAALAGILNGFEVTPENPSDVLASSLEGGASTSRTPVRPPQSAPRIPPATSREQVPEADRAGFDAVVSRVGNRRPRQFLMYSPELARRVFDVADWFGHASEITFADQELLVLAAARELDAPFVWSNHVSPARQAGVSEVTISAVRDRAGNESVEPGERDIVDFARQQLRTHRVTQELFDRLHDRQGTRWLVELTCLLGHWGIMCAIVNAFELAPDPGADHLPLG